MGYWRYVASRLWFFLPFLVGMSVFLGLRSGNLLAGFAALLLAVWFFFIVFCLFGLVRAVVRGKPRAELARPRKLSRQPLQLK